MVAALRKALPDVKFALHLHNDPQTMEGARRRPNAGSSSSGSTRSIAVSASCASAFSKAWRRAGKTIVVYNGVAARSSVGGQGADRRLCRPGDPRQGRCRAASAPSRPRRRSAGLAAGDRRRGRRSVVARPARGAGARARRAGRKAQALIGQVSHAEAMDLLARAEIAAVPRSGRNRSGARRSRRWGEAAPDRHPRRRAR